MAAARQQIGIPFHSSDRQISAWYTPRSAAALLALAAIAGYGFYTSLGGQKLLAGTLLEEES